MMNKFILFCEPCGFKKLIEDNPENYEKLPRLEIQSKIPYMDKEGKVVSSKPLVQPIMSKCPKCGRGVILKKITDAYVKTEEKQNLLKEKQCQQEKNKE